MNETVDASGEKPGASTVSVHKDVFSYERLVATSVMEAATFSLSAVDHGLDDSAILCLNGNDDPIRSASVLTVSIPREGWQSMRIWEYCPFSVSRYCRKIVSRLIAFTKDTSIPES